MPRVFALVWILVGSLLSFGCSPFGSMLARNVAALTHAPKMVSPKITAPKRDDARVAVLWVGHATTLIQIDDKFILTDPVWTNAVGQLSPRLVEPGIALEHLPMIDVALISHMHFDHLSVGSLDLLEPKVRELLVPRGGTVYVPNYRFPIDEVARFETFVSNGLRVTAVPVQHVGFRYGADAAWMKESFTGWVVEYHGLTVYFGGDTAYNRDAFMATALRFPKIDLAILPIAPIKPREFMRATHVDPHEALQAFLDLGASHMVPVHYDTFVNSEDRPGDATKVLKEAMVAKNLGEDRIHILPIGGQLKLFPKPVAAAPAYETRTPE